MDVPRSYPTTKHFKTIAQIPVANTHKKQHFKVTTQSSVPKNVFLFESGSLWGPRGQTQLFSTSVSRSENIAILWGLQGRWAGLLELGARTATRACITTLPDPSVACTDSPCTCATIIIRSDQFVIHTGVAIVLRRAAANQPPLRTIQTTLFASPRCPLAATQNSYNIFFFP